MARLRLLLDTHIWLWSVLANERLSKSVRAELESPRNERWLSPISTWEAMLLQKKGRLELSNASAEWFRKAAEFLKEAPVTHEISIASHEISLQHSDPADRFIAATAKVLGLTLVTADAALLDCAEIRTLPNC